MQSDSCDRCDPSLRSAAKRAEIKSDNPDASASDIVSKLGEAWRGLSDAEKKPFEALATKDKERYDKVRAVEHGVQSIGVCVRVERTVQHAASVSHMLPRMLPLPLSQEKKDFAA